MKVLQLIDSLDAGGAERYAISLANGLVQEIEQSYLVVTRKEGILKKQLDAKVSYIFLGKKHAFDWNALSKLKNLIQDQGIDCIHAHGTSFFFATLVKLRYPKVQLIWHNHSGASPQWKGLRLQTIKWASGYFKAIINVNQEQLTWAKQKLKTKSTVYIANFVGDITTHNLDIELAGDPDYRIIALANLRTPKGHRFLVETFHKVQQQFPQATLHLVGRDYEDAYSNDLKQYIQEHSLEQAVFIHGVQENPQAFLHACSVGVLGSSSEGLPMSLLEYGMAGLAVVTTAVGHCPEVVGSFGKVTPYGQIDAFAKAMLYLSLIHI